MPLKHALKSDDLGGCLRHGTGQDFLDPTGKTQNQSLYLIQSGSRTDPEPERRTDKTAFFGEPEPKLNRLNLRSLNLNRSRTFNISTL